MKRLFFLLLLVLMAGCGGSGGGSDTTGTGGDTTGSGDVTITGTVAGTTFVAVDVASDTVVARKVAVSQNGSKVFTVKVQSGKQYKFYLIENEGTDNERVFPLYIGTDNKFNLSTGTCDLGFVSTATGKAKPSKEPKQFSGVGEDITVPAGVAKNQASVFKQSDLAGSWYFFQFKSGEHSQWWRSTLTVDTTGAATSTNSSNSDEYSEQTENHKLNIDPSGVITIPNSDIQLIMSKDKNLFVGVGNSNNGNGRMMMIGIKAGSKFNPSDLAGTTWKGHELRAGIQSGMRGWSRSNVTISGSGLATTTNVIKDPDPSSDSVGPGGSSEGGSVTLLPADNSGAIKVTSSSTLESLYGAITPDKNMMVYVSTNHNAYLTTNKIISFGILVRTGKTTFSQADLMGNWRKNLLGLTTTDAYWCRDLTVIDSNGTENKNRICNGELIQDTSRSTTVPKIDKQGIILVDGLPGAEAIMTPNKQMMVFTKTDTSSNPYEYHLEVYVK